MAESIAVPKTNDEARALFANSGLTYACLTKESLRQLQELIDAEMISSGLIGGAYRCNKRLIWQTSPDGSLRFAGLTCRAEYFDKREAVSFNRDGFIGFAGWASDFNAVPILKAFAIWVERLRGE